MLLNKIQEYIITYKPRLRLSFAERNKIDDSPEIDFDILRIDDNNNDEENICESDENRESVVSDE